MGGLNRESASVEAISICRSSLTVPESIANGDLPDDLAGRFQRAIDDNLELYGQLLQA